MFALGVACVWSERLLRPRVVPLLAGAGVAAALLAPGVRAARPWIDVRHLAGSAGPAADERFEFTQGFGPLNWPRAGRVVFDVRAARPEYWKVVDLDTFDGRGFAPASASREPLPAPDPRRLAHDTQTITVNIRALRSSEVISAGATQLIWRLPGNLAPSLSPGAFTVDPPLSAGTSYDAVAYVPRPSASALARITDVPALPALGPYLAMFLPAGAATEVIQFPAFHTGATDGLAGTPYAPVYALAQRLARAAPTPAALVRSVMGLLAHGFVYDEHPAASPDPLVSFLLATHRGYCQQFAGAMALLLRMGGVPARVVGGFTTGTFDTGSGRWVVQDTNAHDWVEVWFPRVGWVTFDPTPAVDPALARSVPLPSPLPSAAGASPRPRAAAARRHRELTGAAPGSRHADPPAPRRGVVTRRSRGSVCSRASRCSGASAGRSPSAGGAGDGPRIRWRRSCTSSSVRWCAAGARRAAGSRWPGSSAGSPVATARCATCAHSATHGMPRPAPLHGEPIAERFAPRSARGWDSPGGCGLGGPCRRGARRRPAYTDRSKMDDAYELFRRGTELLEAGHHHQATIPLSRARDLAPDQTSVREALGRALFHIQHYEQAAAEFRAVIDRAPTNDYALFCLGRSLQMLGRHAEARQPLAQAAAMAPARPRLPALLAIRRRVPRPGGKRPPQRVRRSPGLLLCRA